MTTNTNRIRVTELDFDTIKNNLKTFLRSQTQFQDYDFEGSGLSILLDVLAYNTHYNAFYLNMVANEAFLDSSLLRDSVVSHAKTLGYTPYSTIAARAFITLNVQTQSAESGVLTLQKGHNFASSALDGVSYNFVILEDATVTKTGTYYLFEDLPLVQGRLITNQFVYDESSNPKSIFEIPDPNVDISTLKVTVQESLSNTSSEVYNRISEILDVDDTTKGFFLQEGRNSTYQIYFGDDVVASKLKNGSVIILEYVVTEGAVPNGVDSFVSLDPIDDDESTITITTTSKAVGGSDRESIEQIKYLAPSQFTSQNRLVTFNDYKTYMLSKYPYLDSISVWGGEDEVPYVFGKIFISLKPKQDYFLSELEKQRIIDEIIAPKSMPTIKTEIRDPEFVYLLTTSNVKYRKEKTTLSREGIAQKIRTAIINYKDLYLNEFSTTFVTSKLENEINNSDNSIVGADTQTRVQRRFAPVLNTVTNYEINFTVPLTTSYTDNKLTSTDFVVRDSNGFARTVVLEEVPKSFTGITEIQIVDPGIGYTTAPTVTISGDGLGATAVATIKFGRLESIRITNPGFDYSRATVTISGGGGRGAVATAVVDESTSTLRTVYYNANSERIVVNGNVGYVDYENGRVVLENFAVVSVPANDGLIRITCGIKSGMISSTKNIILTIDENDPSAIQINLESII